MIKLIEYANINTSEIEIAGKSYYYDDSLYNTGSLLAWSIRNNEPVLLKQLNMFSVYVSIFLKLVTFILLVQTLSLFTMKIQVLILKYGLLIKKSQKSELFVFSHYKQRLMMNY